MAYIKIKKRKFPISPSQITDLVTQNWEILLATILPLFATIVNYVLAKTLHLCIVIIQHQKTRKHNSIEG